MMTSITRSVYNNGKFCFWNVYRLGQQSQDIKKDEYILATLAQIMFEQSLNQMVCLLCEVVSSIKVKDTQKKDIGEIKKKGITKDTQLGYAAFILSRNESGQYKIADLVLKIIDINQNNFQQQSKRNVVKLKQKLSGFSIYIYHANASNLASSLVTDVVKELNTKHNAKNPFILLGDFNCPPSSLNGSFYIYSSGQPTHAGGQELDYAISNINDGIRIQKIDSVNTQQTQVNEDISQALQNKEITYRIIETRSGLQIIEEPIQTVASDHNPILITINSNLQAAGKGKKKQDHDISPNPLNFSGGCRIHSSTQSKTKSATDYPSIRNKRKKKRR